MTSQGSLFSSIEFPVLRPGLFLNVSLFVAFFDASRSVDAVSVSSFGSEAKKQRQYRTHSDALKDPQTNRLMHSLSLFYSLFFSHTHTPTHTQHARQILNTRSSCFTRSENTPRLLSNSLFKI